MNTDRFLKAANPSSATSGAQSTEVFDTPCDHPMRPSRRGFVVAAASASTALAANLLAAAPARAAAPAGPVSAGPGTGKVAVVTGSSRGIGAATARRLAADGYAVAVNCVVNRELAAGVVREIERAGGRAIWQQTDVSDAQEVKRLFDHTEQAFGGVDVVVANAGIMRLAPFAAMRDEDFDRMLSVNARGSFNTLREASRRVRDGGRIVAMSSSITQLRTGTYGPYAATKMAQDIAWPKSWRAATSRSTRWPRAW